MRLLPPYLLAVVVATLHVSEAGAQGHRGAASDWKTIAAPDRLRAIRDACWGASLSLRLGTADQRAEGLRLTYECLVAAAVEEARLNLVSEKLTIEEFETHLRSLSDERAQLVVDLNVKHGRCEPACDALARSLYGQARAWAVEYYLDIIWAYYRMGVQ